jgi:hypothetical protein
MLRLINRVKIYTNDGSFITIETINEVTITRSFDTQTQTAKVILPRNLRYENKNIYEGTNPLIKRGNKIELYAGYYPNIPLLFSGYISKINNNVPLEILCEDEMFLLKQKQAPNLSYKSVNLRTFIEKMLGDSKIPFEALDAELGQIRTQNASIGKVLQVLRDEPYGLYSYFINGTLYVGLPFQTNLAKEQVFLFERQMIVDGMDLIYLKKEDVKVIIKGVIVSKDNKKTEYVYLYEGDKLVSYESNSAKYDSADGALRTLFQYGGTKKQLDVSAKIFMEQVNYTGYYGSFNTFLEPTVVPGDHAIIDSYKYPERKGTYLIKSVETSFGTNGGRQKIELERKIA